MEDQPTCGKGVAAQSKLSAALAELIAGMARVLDLHQEALDLTDENARPEHHAYVTLVIQLQSAADQLSAIARLMTSYRDLPMGRHDEARMAAPDSVEAFRHFVDAERSAMKLLAESLQDHEGLLEQMQ
jgi:hypothetical protein